MTAADVPDDEVLYRLVDQLMVDAHGAPTSFAFRTSHSDGLSTYSASHVDLATLARENPERGIVSVTAGDVRACGAEVVRDHEDPAHVLIRGNRKKYPKPLSLLAEVLCKPKALRDA